MNSQIEDQMKELNIEDTFSVVFIVLGILSIYGDYIQRKYLRTKNKNLQEQAMSVFNLILWITVILYLLFLYRNYQAYQKSTQNQKKLFSVKLLGSCFFLAGILCSLYFFKGSQNSIGAPEI